MAKRKQSSGELRSASIPLQVHKYRELSALRAGAVTYWNAEHIQPFFPPIETLFKTNTLDNIQEYGIKFDEQIQSITSKNTIQTTSGPKQVHIKQTMVLSPFKWMRGDYSTVLGLSTSQEHSHTIGRKLQSPNNAAYVGSLFSSVFSQSKCIHFPKVFGVFSGISRQHKLNISDDYEDLIDKSWFTQNIGKTFELKLSDSLQSGSFNHTRAARCEMGIGETIELDNIEEIDGIESEDVVMSDMKPMFVSHENEDSESDSSSVSTSYMFELHSCKCEDKEDTLEDDDDDNEGFANAIFENVPVQYTVMEKCEGTLHLLFRNNPDSVKHTAWMSQVMFALLFAQKTFGFVHNDLHSNNVMYVSTDKEFLYYKVSNRSFKVPTHGYIIKLIDFERGTGSIKIAGMKDPKFFISDHFSVNEEAGGQYNIEPFYINKYPSVKPNPSFDLVRLSTSLFWDLFPNGPTYEPYKNNLMFQGLMKWLKVDNNNILFSKENPKHERYHGFNLYKAIARLCKDTAVPRKEIESLPFIVDDVPMSEYCLCLE